MRGYGKLTQTAGTVISRLVEPWKKAYTRISDLWYNAGATAHVITAMRPLYKVTTSAAAAAGQAVINISADPGNYSAIFTINTANNLIAANDYVVYQTADGNYTLDTVSSVSTLAITMTNNVPTAGVLNGADFWWFGITTDTNPGDNQAHPQFDCPASGVTKFGSDPGEAVMGFIGTIQGLSPVVPNWKINGQNEPMILQSNNATNAGTMEKVAAVYTMDYK
jgi:hypothetical protein